MKNITVIGAGTMGNGIAHVFAQNNYKVNLVDISAEALDKAMLTIASNLARLLAKERITEVIQKTTLSNITLHTSMKEGLEHADLVVEAATENIDLKLKIFADIDSNGTG